MLNVMPYIIIIAYIPRNALLFTGWYMFLLLVIDRFLHIALPFRYKRIMTNKKVKWSITSSWSLGLALATYGATTATYDLIPQYAICDSKINSASYILIFILFSLLVLSTCTIVGTRALQNNPFQPVFQKFKENTC